MSVIATDEAVFAPCPPDPSCPHCNKSAPGSEGKLNWSFLDGAYCISLKTRDDRFVLSAAEFHKVGLCRSVMFYRPDRHPSGFRAGCWESHRAVALHALAHGQKTILICEDDVLFARRIRPSTLTSIEHALKKLPPSWMIFFLGHWPLRAWFIEYNILRTSSACTHAYIASPRLLKWLQDHPYGAPGISFSRIAGKCIDSAYAMLDGTYAYFPMLAIQRASRSDHVTKRERSKTFKLRHIITRSQIRELLLSKLMRPFEIAVALASPVFFLAEFLRGKR